MRLPGVVKTRFISLSAQEQCLSMSVPKLREAFRVLFTFSLCVCFVSFSILIASRLRSCPVFSLHIPPLPYSPFLGPKVFFIFLSIAKAAFFNGGSTTFIPFATCGSTFAACRSICGVIREKFLSQRGPHLAAWEARRSSKPGMRMRRGAAHCGEGCQFVFVG